MFLFDDLFERYDPCTALLAEVERDYRGTCGSTPGASTADLAALVSLGRDEAYAKLLEHPVGADLRPASIEAVRKAAVLVDVRKVFQLTAASVALGLSEARDHSPEEWERLAYRCASRAVETCTEEERTGFERNHDIPYPMADHYNCLRAVLEIPFEKLRVATVSINELPDHQRLPIVRVFLQGTSPGEVVIETERSLDQVITSLQGGLSMLMDLRINKEA